MKILIASFILLASILSLLPFSVFSACSHGRTDCRAPGECGRYIDSDGDGICDESQQLTLTAQNTPQPALGVKQQLPSENPSTLAENTAAKKPDNRRDDIQSRRQSPRQMLFSILTAMTVLVVISEAISAISPGTKMFLRFFWNWLLLLSFIAISATSLLCIYTPRFINNSAVSYWHTASGLVFIFAGIYHTAKRFKCMIKPASGLRPVNKQ
ncbi:MAG: hypothetical protein A2X34_07395 [Elusimicrobia bacterium GWC2_51_8]|nr:MAG: hypothetical protein A2X33_00565 [Elusimicrobia bacterium GWA2_51_34]OGR58740.1 MAG: hypothetical protein A2X34_07395 [Elusimicrobia bacterium GWC2_51_8]OGR86243.1 MAG: hypothetical protein A2021_00720 [Elusimicrobia bacterium GWF2_52_66]HAF96364.1 hypothetical protein [Elusimicrobiota bacterium]HCE98550.1 hypothetical protein [Elusimicrobiota bacterium]